MIKKFLFFNVFIANTLFGCNGPEHPFKAKVRVNVPCPFKNDSEKAREWVKARPFNPFNPLWVQEIIEADQSNVLEVLRDEGLFESNSICNYQPDPKGPTYYFKPLHWAAAHGAINVIKYLIIRNAQDYGIHANDDAVECRGQMAAQVAFACGQVAAFRELLSTGYVPSPTTRDGQEFMRFFERRKDDDALQLIKTHFESKNN